MILHTAHCLQSSRKSTHRACTRLQRKRLKTKGGVKAMVNCLVSAVFSTLTRKTVFAWDSFTQYKAGPGWQCSCGHDQSADEEKNNQKGLCKTLNLTIVKIFLMKKNLTITSMANASFVRKSD